MQNVACAELFRPEIRRKALAYDATLVVSASLVLALSAQLAVPIGPVPFTAQTLAVTLLGSLLGARRGALAVAAYLAQGAMGLPWFAGGMGGLAHLLGPTGGYLLGFLPAAALCGWFAERGWDRRLPATLAYLTLGHACIFAVGLAWLSLLTSPALALATGFYPFLLGAVLKIALATALLPLGWKALARLRG